MAIFFVSFISNLKIFEFIKKCYKLINIICFESILQVVNTSEISVTSNFDIDSIRTCGVCFNLLTTGRCQRSDNGCSFSHVVIDGVSVNVFTVLHKIILPHSCCCSF